jgi:hypothetical protein
VPAFLRTPRFLLRFDAGTPVDAPARERVARVLAAHLERFGLAPGARRAGGKRVPIVPLDAEETARLVERSPEKEGGA